MVLPALVLTVLLLCIPGFNVPVTTWRGYHLLLVDGEAELDPVLDSLELAGIDLVSIRNTHVNLNIFSGIETLPLAAAKVRIDTNDPRFDPYIRSAGEYFSAEYRAKKWHAVYLRSHRSQLRLVRILERSLGPLGIEYRIPEWRGGWIIGAPVALYGFVFFLVSGRRRTWRLFLVFLPLGILSVRAAGLGLAAAITLTPGWICLFEIFAEILEGFLYNRKVTFNKAALLRGTGVFCAGLACAFILSTFHIDSARFCRVIIVTTAALVAWVAGIYGLDVMRELSSGHKVFLGIQLLQGTAFVNRIKSRRIYIVYGALLFAGLVFAPALVLISRVDFSLAVAKPAVVRSPRGITGESLAILAKNETKNRLPDLSDYVTHRAYQDSLLYGREWIYPEVNSGVTIIRYREEDEKVIAGESRVISFDSGWFDGVISDAAADGLGGMLIAQGGDIGVLYRNNDKLPFLRVLKSLAIAVLVIIPLIFLWPRLTSSYSYVLRNLPLRRKRQTA